MNSRPDSDSWLTTEGTDTHGVTDSPEEVQCSSILAYLDKQGGLREMYIAQQEL